MIPIQMTSKISAEHGNSTLPGHVTYKPQTTPSSRQILLAFLILIRGGGNNYETFPSEKLSLEHKRPLLLRHTKLKCGVCTVAHYLEVITIHE